MYFYRFGANEVDQRGNLKILKPILLAYRVFRLAYNSTHNS